MVSMADVVAIIPSHTRSKRVPRKNFEVFGGLTALEHAIRKARLIGITEIVVVTDEKELRHNWVGGCYVFDAPQHLTRARTAAHWAYLEWTSLTGREAEIVLQLEPAGILFTRPDRFVRMIEMVRERPHLHCQFVVKTAKPLFYIFQGVVDDVSVPLPEISDEKWRDTFGYMLGAGAVCSTSEKLKENPMFGRDHLCVETSRREAFDIDWPEDLEYAHYIWGKPGWDPYAPTRPSDALHEDARQGGNRWEGEVAGERGEVSGPGLRDLDAKPIHDLVHR